jgi:hypothetical protein
MPHRPERPLSRRVRNWRHAVRKKARGLTRSCSPNVTFDSRLSGLVLAVAFDEGERDLGDVFPAAVEYK